MTYRYDYDTAGNINEVYRQVGSGTLDFLNSYKYDKLGRLTSATYARGTETYSYNTVGNLLSRTLVHPMQEKILLSRIEMLSYQDLVKSHKHTLLNIHTILTPKA